MTSSPNRKHSRRNRKSRRRGSRPVRRDDRPASTTGPPGRNPGAPTTKVLRAKTPTDVLAMVPRFLGFHPDDSVVLVTLGEATRPLHARLDLPTDPDEVEFVADYLTSVATRHGIRRAVVVVYTDDEVRGEDAGHALIDALEAAGVGVPLAMRADGSRWWCMVEGCSRPQCPPEGTPYDLSSHPFTADAVLDGKVVLGSREELRDSLVGNDPEEVAAVASAADRAMDRFEQASRQRSGEGARIDGSRVHLVQEGQWVAERVRRFLADGRRLDAEEVGRLIVAMVAIEVRDVAWAEMTRGNAQRHVDLWRDVVRRAPLDLLAAPAALLGFAAWLSGDGALAWCAVDRCQQSEPDYSLAGLLTQALAGAVPPSSWRPLDRGMLTLFAG